jgi:hypothetical protein
MEGLREEWAIEDQKRPKQRNDEGLRFIINQEENEILKWKFP